MKQGKNKARYKSEQCPPLAFRLIFKVAWPLQTAEASVVHAHTPPSTYISVQVSLQRSAALRGPGLLNLRLAPPSRHDVSGRESERERGGQY